MACCGRTRDRSRLDATSWLPYYSNQSVATCREGTCSSMSTKEETTTTIIRALNDAVNARDRQATVALFASDGVFYPGAAGAAFEGPEPIADALFGFLNAHKSGHFETLREVLAGDEAYHEWKWAGITNEGELAETHGCDYYRIRDGKVAVRSTFRKVLP